MQRISWLIGPSSGASVYPEEATEREFLTSYRGGALRSAFFAASGAGLIYLAFLVIARLSEPYESGAVLARFCLSISLFCVALTYFRAPKFAIRHYLVLSAGASAIGLGGVVYLLSLGPHGSALLQGGASPALVFGLFIHYAFLRLPLWCAAGIGWIVSVAFFLWASPMVIGGNAEVRTLVYLVFTNIMGMSVCQSFEVRERELFFQRRRVEAAQVEAGERALAAEEAHAEKSRLLAAVSHDLRQPIMAASTYLSVLQSKLKNGDMVQVRRQFEHLGNSIGMLGATLDHLLTAARYDSGNEPIRIEGVELRPLLEQLQQTFESEAQAKGIELRVRQSVQRTIVTTDATALWRILMNLVSNAIKFTSSDGRLGRGVLVRTRIRAGVCQIDVVDTGLGIEERNIRLIWQAYFQVQNSERNRARGLGLGLFLVKRALDHLPSHELTLRSRLGRGSRFSLRLPGMLLSDRSTVVEMRRDLDADMLRLLRGGYVLVLEDDWDARRAIEELLDDWGVLYVSGATLEELLPEALNASRPPDALITDFRLPGRLTGVGCVQELRRLLKQDFPAVIITGESDLASVREAMPTDAVLLPKPFDSHALAAPLLAAVQRARRAESI